jgi:hypothetical protein
MVKTTAVGSCNGLSSSSHAGKMHLHCVLLSMAKASAASDLAVQTAQKSTGRT